MLKGCLYLVGMIVIPLAVEVFLAPRACLALLWTALPLPRRFADARIAARTDPRMPHGTAERKTNGLIIETGMRSYLRRDMALTDPRFLDASTSNAVHVPRKPSAKRLFTEKQREEIGSWSPDAARETS